MSYNYRCSKGGCRARKSLPKKYEDYIFKPKCPFCKKDSLRHDPSVKIRAKKQVCNCDGIIYPHKKGTEPWCNHAKVGPTEEDYIERYGT